jgi:hypothetical protein
MVLRTPPSWLQNGSHPAENDRLTTQAFFSTTGIVGSTSLAVAQNGTPNMSVNVASGWAAIVGTTQTNMGTYIAYNDATVNAAITTSNASNPRIDLVCITVSDAFYTGTLNQVAINVVAGTPAASPVAPATPANSIVLAQVAVAAGTSSIVTANITDARVTAGSNFVTPSGSATLTNKILASDSFTGPLENSTVSATAATGTINFDCITQGVLYYTTNASANFTLNFRGNSTTTLNSLLAVGQAISVVFLNTNGTTAYYASAFQIDGTSVTPKWVGGTAPSSGNASAIDSYSFTIVKTAASTYTVLAGGATKFA